MALKVPRGRKPIRVEKQKDPRYMWIIVELGGSYVLPECTSLPEVIRRLELWPVPHLRAKISYRGADGVVREQVHWTGPGKKLTAYVSGMKDIHPDPNNHATLPSWRRRPVDHMTPHVRNDVDAGELPVTVDETLHRPFKDARDDPATKKIRKLRDFKI